jgi:hypothetical protein
MTTHQHAAHFTADHFTPKDMHKAVKAEQASASFKSRWHRHPPQSANGQRQRERTVKLETSILAAIIGEMSASQIANASGCGVPTAAAVLNRMVTDGRVVRRYSYRNEAKRQIGLYTAVERVGDPVAAKRCNPTP